MLPNEKRSIHKLYTKCDIAQLQLAINDKFLSIPSFLEGFHNTNTTMATAYSKREVFCFNGILDITEFDTTCPKCGAKMHINAHQDVTLRHLCFGSSLSCVCFDRP